jgi:hypothetical protein
MPTVEIDIAAGVVPYTGLSTDTLDISFFIPCYNEESNVLGAIDKIVRVANKLGLSYVAGSHRRGGERLSDRKSAASSPPVRERNQPRRGPKFLRGRISRPRAALPVDLRRRRRRSSRSKDYCDISARPT